MGRFDFFKEKEIKDGENETLNIFQLISGIRGFQYDENHTEDIEFFEKTIIKIYKELIILTLNGNFRQLFSKETNIIQEVSKKINEFLNYNDGFITRDFTNNIKNPLYNLQKDLESLNEMREVHAAGRKVAYFFDSIPDFRYENQYYRKLFISLIHALLLDRNIVDFNILSMHKILNLYAVVSSIVCDDNEFEYLKLLVSEKIEFIIYKIRYVFGKNDIWIFKDQKIRQIETDFLNGKDYSNVKRYLNFLREPVSKTKYISEFDLKSKLKESDYNDMLSLRLLAIYYKDNVGNLQGLRSIINEYEKIHGDKLTADENMYYINYIYIKNCYLSLLIKEFIILSSKSINNDVDYNELSDLKESIEITFNELTFKKKKKNYRNYFTYYKYSFYKLNSAIYYREMQEYKRAKDEIQIAKENIKRAYELFRSDMFHEYYEYDDGNNFADIEKPQGITLNIDKVYSLNLYKIPFDFETKRNDILNTQNEIFKNDVLILSSGKIDTVDKKINDYKVDSITVVGIFTAIVVYSLGVIQIFSIIEDMGSAMMFAGIFLSGVLMVLFGIFLYKDRDNGRKNGWTIFWISIGILAISFILGLIFKGYKIDSNRGENIYEKLNNSIYQATLLKESLNDIVENSKVNGL